MQVEKIPASLSFTPISYAITFQSEEEYNALRRILGYNVTLPALVGKEGTPEFINAQNVVDSLRMGLYAI